MSLTVLIPVYSEEQQIGEILDYGWHHKKKTAGNINNPRIEEIYQTARKAGAAGGKVSGAGGAIKKALNLCSGGQILILNGDTIFKCDINGLKQFHNDKKADITITVRGASGL